MPAVLVFVISIVFPFITNIIDFFAASVLLFNGVITPVFLKIKMLSLKSASRFKLGANILLGGTLTLFMLVAIYKETVGLIDKIN